MLKAFLILCQLILFNYYCLISNSKVLAQVTPDNTSVDTQVDENGNVSEITGGQTRGSNLFHSFQDFSVPTGNEAFFNNVDSISNIFSRVTGGNVSTIDGAIRANGSANLFLINPAGIIFGNNARLDIGGSFLGSTSSSILFEGGEFSATDLDNPPMLTINAPIGLGFRDEPRNIINRSSAQNSAGRQRGLEVLPGNNLTLVGGDISFETGAAIANGGNINLGGLSETGTVGIDKNGSLNFPEDVAKADVTLRDNSAAIVRGSGNGNIAVNARNLTLEAGELGSSNFIAGIKADSTNAEAQAGNIVIDVAENISLDNSSIRNLVGENGSGNSGNIIIDAGSINATSGGQIDTTTSGRGNSGDININATGNLAFDGENLASFPSGVISEVSSNAIGDAGNITISTNNLTLTNGGLIDTATSGEGNAGNIEIEASNFSSSGETSQGIPSSILSSVNSDAVGNAGSITISTGDLTLNNGGFIGASTNGRGNAGDVNINARNITMNGESRQGRVSAIFNGVVSDGVGNAGSIAISTNDLTLSNGGSINANTNGRGNAGDISVETTGNITLGGENSEAFPSNISNEVSPNGIGDAGNIAIATNNLTLNDGGFINASTVGQGNAGNVDITATENISFDGENSLGDIRSGAGSEVIIGAEGDGGAVTISTTNLTLTNGGVLGSSTNGKGNAGSIEIFATGDITFDGESSQGIGSGTINKVDPDGVGDAGGITISANNLTLTNGGLVSAKTLGEGNAGNINITTTKDMNFSGESPQGFSSRVESLVDFGAVGDAGGINISSSNLTLNDGGLINASTFGGGNAGGINISATGSTTISGVTSQNFPSSIISIVGEDIEGNAGNINISTDNLTLNDGGLINGSTLGGGNAGGINISATESISISGAAGLFPNGIFASAFINSGNGGNINVSTEQLNISENGAIEAGNFDRSNTLEPGTGQAGNIKIEADSIALADEAAIETATQSEIDEGGNINLQVSEDMTLRDRSLISARAFNNADGGNLNIEANYIFAFPNGNSDIIANAERGNGGNIEIEAESLFGIEERPLNSSTNDINAGSEFSLDGRIKINTPDVSPVNGLNELPGTIVIPEETSQQACQANRESAAKNGLTIEGKGGIPPTPDLPLTSQNIFIGYYEAENDSTSIPQAIETSKGKIQPARGIEVNKSGEVILTTYRTNNSGKRIAEGSINCGV